jgi:hypothetical protein
MSVNDPGNSKNTSSAPTVTRLERWALLAEIVGTDASFKHRITTRPG